LHTTPWHRSTLPPCGVPAACCVQPVFGHIALRLAAATYPPDLTACGRCNHRNYRAYRQKTTMGLSTYSVTRRVYQTPVKPAYLTADDHTIPGAQRCYLPAMPGLPITVPSLRAMLCRRRAVAATARDLLISHTGARGLSLPLRLDGFPRRRRHAPFRAWTLTSLLLGGHARCWTWRRTSAACLCCSAFAQRTTTLIFSVVASSLISRAFNVFEPHLSSFRALCFSSCSFFAFLSFLPRGAGRAWCGGASVRLPWHLL